MQENEKEKAELEEDDDMISSKLLTATGILHTLRTLILSLETNPELLRALEDAMQPILVFVLENGFHGNFILWCI